jgi:hypothetical protein
LALSRSAAAASPERAHGPRQHIAGSQRSNLDILDGQELADAVAAQNRVLFSGWGLS